LVALAPAAAAELARRHLGNFCALMDPSYEAAAHTERLCAELEAVELGAVDRLMVFLPPRHGKSLHTSSMFPAWWLGRHPRSQVILAAYAAEKAEDYSRSVRALLKDARYPFPARVSEASA